MEKGLNAILNNKSMFDEIRGSAMQIIHAADELQERLECLRKFTEGFGNAWKAIDEKFSSPPKPQVKIDETLGTEESLRENDKINAEIWAKRNGK